MIRHGAQDLLIIAVLITATCSGAMALDWDVCKNVIAWELGNQTISLSNRTIFQPSATAEAPSLTLPGCLAYCGSGITWYGDTGPILNTWLIPVLVLISQMDVSPLDKRTYLVVLHLLGDPIDSIYSLLLKLENWSRCRRIAETLSNGNHAPAEQRMNRLPPRESSENQGLDELVRIRGTVLGGIEELIDEGADPRTVYRRLASQLSPQKFRAVANELANSRTDDIYRTCLAVALYFYQVACAFISNLGGTASSPPGGRIAISMFMTYVLPVVLLSNLIGGFPSAYTCYCIIQHHLPDGTNLLEIIGSAQSNSGVLEQYFKSRSWSGGIYTFRPQKKLFETQLPGDDRRLHHFLLAISPVVISTAISLTIMWHLPPAGPNCRWFVLLAISCAYFVSAFLTFLTRYLGLQGRRHWRVTLIKDFFIAVPSMFLLFASSAGLFNSCWCWSGVYKRGRQGATIALNTELSFKPYIHKLYPALFGACLVLQLCSFGLMFLSGRKGLALMRWSRKERAGIIEKPSETLDTELQPLLDQNPAA